MTNAPPPSPSTSPSTSPSPPAPSASILLINLGRQARERVDARLREQGLGYRHLSALGHLRRQPGLSYSELARRASVTTQSMQGTVARLEQRGLVDHREAAGQGRRADLHVTERGDQVLEEAETAVRAVDDELFDELDPSERQQLEQVLMRVFRARRRAT